MTPIPLARPQFDDREMAAVQRVLDSGWVVQGREVAEFECAIAQLHQARHCIAVSSGTAALHAATIALDIGPGDAVFVPSFAWPAAAGMAVAAGARPVFVDVLPDTFNLDPENLREQIKLCGQRGWGRPRAIVPVHEFGLAADMDEILAVAQRHDLEMIEDAACALGASWQGRPVGTIGKLGTFSFHPRKAITTGEGGAIVTNDDELAQRCREFRNHGQAMMDGHRDFRMVGMNYRLTEIQAAIGLVQLAKFPEILRKRRELAAQYLAQLADQPGISLPQASPDHTWQTFMVVLAGGFDRDMIVEQLATLGIGAGPGSVAGHCAAVYRERFGYQPDQLPCSARLDRAGLALPLHSGMNPSDLSRCVASVRQALSECAHSSFCHQQSA